MLVYNVTLKVNWPIHEAWVKWMKEKHIPDVLNTKCFTGNRFMRLLETDEEEGPTYVMQYFAESRGQYDQYIELHAPAMRKDLTDNWGDNFIAFRSLMELVN